jgi:hypothetical protein
MFTPGTWEFLRKAGILVGLTGAAITLAWFCFTTVNRIGALENQMQALVVTGAKSLISAPESASAPLMQDNRAKRPASDPVVQVNPIVQVCADLAKQLAQQSYLSVTDPIGPAMERLNCRGLKN